MTLPGFVTATVLIYVFAIKLAWFPAVTLIPTDAPISKLLPNIVLPIITLTLIMVAHILRLVRTNMIDVMSSDYVQMARLKGEPAMLVLDEPTTGLGVTTQAHILKLLREIVSKLGTAMMYISHDMGVIARVSDRVALLYAGEIVEDATAAEMFKSPAHPYARGLLASIPRLSLAGIPSSIPGSLPGCSFAPRCPFAEETCASQPPELATMPGKPAWCAVTTGKKPSPPISARS